MLLSVCHDIHAKMSALSVRLHESRKRQVDPFIFIVRPAVIVWGAGRLQSSGCAIGRPSFDMSRSFRCMLCKYDLYLLPKQFGEKVRNCAFLHSVRCSMSPFKERLPS